MRYGLQFVCVIVVVLFTTSYGLPGVRNRIPSFLKVCHRSNPNLNECVKESVDLLKPFLDKGIPELGIPPLEPLIIPEVVMNQGKGSVTVSSTYRNINVYGPSQFVLRQLKLDLEKNRVKVKVLLPELHMVSNYTINGRILMLPIAGTGHCIGNYSDIEATVVMQGERIEKNGKTYFNVIEIFIDFVIGHASVYLSNLFDGDRELGDAMNLFLNDNWRSVAQEFKPVLEETIGELFKKFANKIFNKYPMDQLLPP